MILGVMAMLCCTDYMFYMNSGQERNNYHVMIKPDETMELVKKTSRWTD